MGDGLFLRKNSSSKQCREVLSFGRYLPGPLTLCWLVPQESQGKPLSLNGSVPAKQNHSSVAAHLGLGASWSIMEQVSKLLERQKHLISKRQKKDIQAIVGTHNYKSRLQDQAGLDDKTAK